MLDLISPSISELRRLTKAPALFSDNNHWFDNLKNSVYNYKQKYGKDEVYITIEGFSHLAWRHANSLMSLPEIYVKHMYD